MLIESKTVLALVQILLQITAPKTPNAGTIMPSKKRPLQESKPNVVKRVRLSEPELQDFEKPVLIAKVIALQDELENASAAVMEASKPPTESPEQIAEKVERVRKLIIKGILSQMKDGH